MTVIGSDGLSLLVGDGGGTEIFNPLTGCAVSKLEISQRGHVAGAVTTDAWQVHAGMSDRRAMIECEAYATDDAAPLRVRSLMLSGLAGNFKLKLRGTETLQFSAFVTLYREVIAAGEIKKLMCRLESTGAVSVV